ncbi:MAG: hypothetical protein ACK4F6_08250 [Hylemonella sp.]
MIPKYALLLEVETKAVYRVLDEIASPEAPDNTAVLFVLIDVNDKNLKIRLEGKARLMECLANRTWLAKEEVKEPINMAALSAAESRIVQKRRSLIQQVIQHGQKVFVPSFRGQLAHEFVKSGQGSKPFFYNTLRLWWQGGCVESSLVTKFPNCGRKGERRVQEVVDKKPGRPRTVQPGVGLAITLVHLRNMRVAWSRSPVGRDGRNLRSAYTWMLQARYYDELTLAPPEKPRRRAVAAALSDSASESSILGAELALEVRNYDLVPSFEQFRYHWQKEFSYAERKLNRLQRRRFDLAFKPLLTGTLVDVRGPGTRYYIDATVLDVYCVSRLNRNRIVGRPTLYIVADQFSRMVVGIYVGLEPPCWAGAMLALWNCSLDKVKFCAQFGVDISPEEWPTGYMPIHLMGDRGELSANLAELLARAFGLDVENSWAYAGEAKGVVERWFNTLQAKFGLFMPGFVDKEFSGRDAEPAALRAALDIHEITRMVILAVLHANHRVVRGYEGVPELVSDKVPFVPVELWRWGVENLRSDVRQFDSAYLTRNLWPSGTMKFSRRALQFYRGLYFMGANLQDEPWFAQAFAKRTEVETRFNPGDVTRAILLPPNLRSGQIDVSLTRRSSRFAGLTYSEVLAVAKDTNRRNAEAAWEKLPRQVDFERQMHAGSRKAKRQWRNQYDDSLSNAARLGGIKENRRNEIDSLTAEAVGMASLSEPAAPTPQASSTLSKTAVEETANEVEKLLADEMNRGSKGQ